jgi:hypothetical protein
MESLIQLPDRSPGIGEASRTSVTISNGCAARLRGTSSGAGSPRRTPLVAGRRRSAWVPAVVLTTRELEGEATEGADVLTFNDTGKLVTFEALGDTAQLDRVFAK